MGLILNIIASILKWILQPFCYLYGTIVSLKKGEFNQWNRDLALMKDKWGNILIKYLANDILITKNGYKFGKLDETISSVEGKNKKKDTFKYLGKWIAKRLNSIDDNHVENAIK